MPSCRHAGRCASQSANCGWTYVVVGVVALAGSAAHAELPAGVADPATLDPEATRFFENEVRPILANVCQKCHGADKHEGNLRLDSLWGALEGGDTGAVVAPGKPDESLLVEAINYESLEMPPDGKLSDQQIAVLTRWVKLGLPWPGATAAGTGPRKAGYEVTDADRQFWSFRPVARPLIPQVPVSQGTASQPTGTQPAVTPPIANPIDAFIQAKLAEKNLSPSPPASKRELVRRAYFDLIGLPPTADEIAGFESDTSSDAYEKLLDRLLAMPQYGERWARHWLDIVRYAQSNGYERDDEKPFSWRYRDYVIGALNDDKPYDRFLMEQLAGDEIEPVTDESLIATGFYRLGVWDDEPDDKRQAEFDGLDDMLATTSTAMLGLTVGCARCHDHKFDPIPQEDYYSLLAFLRNVKPFANDESILIKLPSGAGQTLGVRESEAEPPPTHVLVRGDSGSPGKQVEPRFPQVLTCSDSERQPKLPDANATQAASSGTSGRRRALAEWVTRRENPLTARVIVNRLWHHHFGRGIVPTPSDFGHTGLPPSHPELLDWLASELVDGGWRLKRIHKLIMLSDTYRQSSRVSNTDAVAIDPDNTLLWRQNLRRLNAEAVRDTILAVNGGLNLARGGPSFFPRLPSEVLSSESRPGLGWGRSDEKQSARRSIYIFFKRTLQVPLLEQFDMAAPDKPTAARTSTTVAPQALTLLNGDFVREQAGVFAERLWKEAGADPQAQIERGYALALGRRPATEEARVSLDFLRRRAATLASQMPRITFHPEVPGALSNQYLGKLGAGGDFFSGPNRGWTYHRGVWEDRGDGITWVDVHRGPFALWEGVKLQDGIVDAALVIPENSELGSVLLRGQVRANAFVGYELLLDPRRQSVSIVRHDDGAVPLASAKASVQTGQLIHLKSELAGGRIRVWLGEASEPLLDATDPRPMTEGQLGVRTWGGSIDFERLAILTGGRTIHVSDQTVMADSDPLPGWKYFGGPWTAFADGSYRSSGSAWQYSVWDAPRIGDGVVECDVLPNESHFAQVLVRVSDLRPGIDAFLGYEVALHAGHGFVRLGRHENNFQHIVDVPRKLDAGAWMHVKIVLEGGRIRIYLGNETEPVIDRTDERPLPVGGMALRSDGAAGFRNLQVATDQEKWTCDFRPAGLANGNKETFDEQCHRKALAAWCLLLLNLNELAYVD